MSVGKKVTKLFSKGGYKNGFSENSFRNLTANETDSIQSRTRKRALAIGDTLSIGSTSKASRLEGIGTGQMITNKQGALPGFGATNLSVEERQSFIDRASKRVNEIKGRLARPGRSLFLNRL